MAVDVPIPVTCLIIGFVAYTFRKDPMVLVTCLIFAGMLYFKLRSGTALFRAAPRAIDKIGRGVRWLLGQR